jgi:hypothetical protein
MLQMGTNIMANQVKTLIQNYFGKECVNWSVILRVKIVANLNMNA